MVRAVKLYTDRAWLQWALYDQKMTIDAIAKVSGTSTKTVYRYLKQYSLIKEK